ncbi:MAG TPA: ATP synthase F0 subunit B [Alphaproteobacteria bacterium]|nr:ATP synthase F0 subunit B [Alphaproteobacteria bacterium]
MELFDFTFLHSQMFWLALCFVVLLVFMYKFAAPGIAKSLDERANQIKADLNAAEELKNQAQELLESYNAKLEKANSEAQLVIQEAKDNAKEIADKRAKELEISLKDKSDSAERQIEAAKNKAIAEIKSEAHTLVITATEKLVLDTVDAKKAKELTKKACDELS